MTGKYFYKIRRDFLSLSGGTVTGDTYFDASLSANTYYSGSTNLYDIFAPIGQTGTGGTGDITRVQPGINTYTGGTDNRPTVNIINSPSFDNIYFSGTAAGGNILGDNIVGTTFFSGGTDLYDIITGISSGGTGADYYTTASTLNGTTVHFDRNDQLSAYTLDLSSLVVSGASDTYVTGGTFVKSTSTITLERNDGNNVIITGLTDFYTTGVTLDSNVLYFDRTDLLSAYTVDLSSIVTSGGTDNFTTGATLNGDIVHFDRNDQLSAYTLDLSSLLSSGNTFVTGVTIDGYNTVLNRNDGGNIVVSGTTTIFSETEPDVLLYSANTWTRTTDHNTFTYDVNRNKWIGSNTDKITGARVRNNNNNIFLRYEDRMPYNINPYYVYSDSVITNVVASDSGLDTWIAVILTGTTLSTDAIYNLNLVADGVKYDDSVNIDVYSGTSLYLYMSGTSVSNPRVDVYTKNI